MNQTELTAIEAHVKILDVIDYFLRENKKHPREKLYAEISDVKFYDIFVLYKRIQGEDKRLFLPKDLDCDYITILFRPDPNCVIQIESVPAQMFKAKKLKPFNFN